MEPIWSIKAIRCVCALIRPVLSTKTTQTLPVYLTVTLCCKQTKANRRPKAPALQCTFPKDNCRVLRPGRRGFYSLVSSDCLKSSDKTLCRCTGRPRHPALQSDPVARQKDSEQQEKISRAIENWLQVHHFQNPIKDITSCRSR